MAGRIDSYRHLKSLNIRLTKNYANHNFFGNKLVFVQAEIKETEAVYYITFLWNLNRNQTEMIDISEQYVFTFSKMVEKVRFFAHSKYSLEPS
jgi:hypothetical protein